ncbi:hypothetical protein [Bowmanella denitrificans]|uniref:hypothetical protein n=1 Tax=Bowmanella denitrificans TaxID=366582 RepID=UPI000C9CF585|nr:hypothetical protein [Bowmanella denitrificans]
MRIPQFGSWGIAEWMTRATGLLFLILAFYGISGFPVFQSVLIGCALVYLLLMFLFPMSWLIAVPLFCVGVDLTQSSGRFIINEWDFLLWLTIAAGFLSGKVAWPGIGYRKMGLLVLLIMMLAVSGKVWLLMQYLVEPIWHNPYYQDAYAAKLAKTAIWALMLLPMLFWGLKDKKAFVHWLVLGTTSAALLLLVTVLWERGVLAVLAEQGLGYGFLNSLLDASSSYRTTGLFSEMHTGGEVIDGVIVLLLPFALAGLIQEKQWLKALSGMALLALLYVTFVGFTRTTYVAVLTAVFIFLLMHLYARKKQSAISVRDWLLPLLLFVALCALALKLTGSIGGVIVVGTLLGAVLVLKIKTLNSAVQNVLLAIGIGFAIYQLAINHFSHKWIVVDQLSIGLLILAAVLMPFALLLLASRLKPLRTSQLAWVLIMLVPALVLTRQMAGGYQIGNRLEAVQADLQTRFDHWQSVIQSGNTDVLSLLFGNGVGSFPRNYLLAHPDSISHTGSFDIRQDAQGETLLLGGSEDMAVGQRVSVQGGAPLKVTARVTNPAQARLGVYLCERNVIFASNTQRKCSGTFFDAPQSAFAEELSLTIPLDGWANQTLPVHWPHFFHIKNYTAGALVEVHSLQLWQNGKALLHNSDFSKGSDHWYFYNDFAHLPWHIKNTYLHWYYELGVAGVTLLVLMFVAALRGRQGNNRYYPAMVAGVCGFAVIGLFGTPLDSARVSLWFYLGLYALLVTNRDADEQDLKAV